MLGWGLSDLSIRRRHVSMSIVELVVEKCMRLCYEQSLVRSKEDGLHVIPEL